MTRPSSLNDLEKIYDDMICRNKVISSWRFDEKISLEDRRTCCAIYSYGSWNLSPIPWKRLQDWLSHFLEYGIKYTVNPNGLEGRLHFTFHQLTGFSESDKILDIATNKFKEFMDAMRGVKIEFRGLLITPTGLALRGYTSDDIQLNKLMRLRDSLSEFCRINGIIYNPPYVNDIIHSTLFRWTRSLPNLLVHKIQSELTRWDECWFGTCTLSEWCYGLGTLLMREPYVQDLVNIKTPIFVAHRGLTDGASKEKENNIENIKKRAEEGLYSEIDVWFIEDKWFVGHDEPNTIIPFEFLLDNCIYLWIHAKNREAFERLIQKRKEGFNFCIFWHTTEDYCFTSNLDVIVYPGKRLVNNCVFMMPENSKVCHDRIVDFRCSDYDA